jgi:hypothetical protein
MSTAQPKIAPLLVAGGAGTEKPKRKRSRPYKARVATKIKWALGDTMDKAVSAQRTMRAVLEWLDVEWEDLAEDNPARVTRLARLDHLLATLALDVCEIERISARALFESKTVD